MRRRKQTDTGSAQGWDGLFKTEHCKTQAHMDALCVFFNDVHTGNGFITGIGAGRYGTFFISGYKLFYLTITIYVMI